MKLQSTYLFFISSFLIVFSSFSQETKKDTVNYKDIYGLRIGLDLSNPIRTLIDSDRKSIEIVADYRINKKFFAAVEIGFLDNFREEDNFEFTTNGQYLKLGFNYNTYKNWLNMSNEIYIGSRYGFSTFSQTLESFTIISANELPGTGSNIAQEHSGLNANWIEFVGGIKTEIYSNIFLGFSFSLKKMLFTKEPNNFKNLYVPGFDRVFLNNSGFGFNYTISYRIPLFKKDKMNTSKISE